MHSSAHGHSAHHGHLWQLPDGTGLHARPGQLTVDDDTGRLCCHLCGRWYVSLGSHVRAHGYTASSYRTEMGICSGEPLIAAALSGSIAARQTDAYQNDERIRVAFAAGAKIARRAVTDPPKTPEPQQRIARRRAALQAGRQTIAARRHQDLVERLNHLGHSTLAGYLRSAYATGASLETLAMTTGLGRARLRAELDAAGVQVRATGINTAAGRRSRAVAAEQAAAQRLRTDDLHGWLRDRRADGWPLTRLAAAVGHSTHWVQWRLSPTA
ncbi:hypothetical protein ACWKSP_20715 [Micromonosporaceae bacterium Da 78-11]